MQLAYAQSNGASTHFFKKLVWIVDHNKAFPFVFFKAASCQSIKKVGKLGSVVTTLQAVYAHSTSRLEATYQNPTKLLAQYIKF